MRCAIVLGLAAAVACGKSEPASSGDDGGDATARTAPSTSSSAPSSRPQTTSTAPTPTLATTSPAPATGALNACDAPGFTTCFDAKYALHCVQDKYEVIPCKGPKGCQPSKEGALCDDNVSAEGDPCLMPAAPSEANYACTPDHKTQLVCKDRKFQASHACRGPKGCTISAAGKVDCDATLAEPGDACEAGAFACKVDHLAMLECKGGKFTVTNSCHGAKGCVVNGATRKAECDDSLANLGEPCEPANEERCSVDKKVALKCVGGKYAKKKDCPKRGCAAPSAGRAEPTCD